MQSGGICPTAEGSRTPIGSSPWLWPGRQRMPALAVRESLGLVVTRAGAHNEGGGAMTQFAGCAGRICRQAHRGGFRRRRSARCLGFVTRCGAASAASLLIVLALASPAGATFSGRNGVLLLTSGGGSGSVGLENPFSNFRVRGAVRVGQAPPSARTAECAYPARLATVRPDGTHGKDIGQGDRGLFSPLGFRLALHDSGDPCWGYGSDPSGPDPSIGVYIARRNGEHRRSVSGDGIAGWLPDGRLVVWQSAAARHAAAVYRQRRACHDCRRQRCAGSQGRRALVQCTRGRNPSHQIGVCPRHLHTHEQHRQRTAKRARHPAHGRP